VALASARAAAVRAAAGKEERVAGMVMAEGQPPEKRRGIAVSNGTVPDFSLSRCKNLGCLKKKFIKKTREKNIYTYKRKNME